MATPLKTIQKASVLSEKHKSKFHFISDIIMCTSSWHNYWQHGGDDGFQTKVQVLQVTHTEIPVAKQEG